MVRGRCLMTLQPAQNSLKAFRSSSWTLLPRLVNLWATLSVISLVAQGKTVSVTLTTNLLPEQVPLPVLGAAIGNAGGYAGGAITQHLKLLSLITLGLHLRVDKILIPAVVSRVQVEGFLTQWQAESPSTLWDMVSIDILLHKHGVKMVPASSHIPPPGSHFLPSYSFKAMSVHKVADDVRLFCRKQLAIEDTNNLTLVAPDLLLAIKTESLPLYREVASSVKFAPPLLDMAKTIVSILRNRSATFNSVHFRLDGRTKTAAIKADLQTYFRYMADLKFAAVPLYVASGIFADGGKGHYGTVASWLHEQIVGQGLASVVLNRHVVLRHHPDILSELSKLHTEQRAVVDFLVMMHAEKIVGSRASSFTFILREFRALNNISRDTVGIVGDPWWLLPVAAGIVQ